MTATLANVVNFAARHGSREQSGRGFTLLELVVVIVVISILLGVAITRLLPYIDEAERVAVITLEGQLRSSLGMEAARRIARGQSASISALEGSNPVKFLLEPPKNYVGELEKGAVGQAPERHWYFETERHRLVYRLGAPFGLPVRDESLEDPAFVVSVAYADNDGDGFFEAGRDELYGIRLQRVAGVKWLSGTALE